MTEPLLSHQKEPQTAVHAETLVLYVHAGSDPEYAHNLHFFLREGIHVSHEVALREPCDVWCCRSFLDLELVLGTSSRDGTDCRHMTGVNM